MDGTVRVRGPYAELRVGGRLAARIHDWTMVGSARAWVCRGRLSDPDPYWLAQAGADGTSRAEDRDGDDPGPPARPETRAPASAGGRAGRDGAVLVAPVGGVRWVWRAVRVVRWMQSVGRTSGRIEVAGHGDPEAR